MLGSTVAVLLFLCNCECLYVFVCTCICLSVSVSLSVSEMRSCLTVNAPVRVSVTLFLRACHTILVAVFVRICFVLVSIRVSTCPSGSQLVSVCIDTLEMLSNFLNKRTDVDKLSVKFWC